MLSIIQAAGWPIWPLILCSVLALALIIERLFQLQTRKVAPSNTLEKAMEATRSNLPSEEVVRQLETMGVLGPVLASGIRNLQQNPQATHKDVPMIVCSNRDDNNINMSFDPLLVRTVAGTPVGLRDQE